MYVKKIEDHARCPIEYIFKLFSGKWNIRIFCLINVRGVVRFSDFQNEIQGISEPVLSSTLKAFMKQGIINRTIYDERPIRVEYSLTEKGKSVVPILQDMCVWSKNNASSDIDFELMNQCTICPIPMEEHQ